MDTTDQAATSSGQVFTNQWVDSLWFRIFLLTSLGLGVFFRVSGLGNKIYSHDEAFTSLRAAGYVGSDVIEGLWDGSDKTAEDIQRFLQPRENKNILDTLAITALQPHQAPGYFLLAHVWMRWGGYLPADMRGLPVLFGILSIPAMYWLSWELFASRRIALLSTLLFAISPFHILLSQDARPYSLWTLAITLSSASFLRAMRKDQAFAWVIYSLTLILGMYSHQLFFLVAVVHGIHFAVIMFLRSKKRFTGFLAATLFAVLVYSPWLFVLITGWQRAATRMAWVNIQIPWYRLVQRWALVFTSPFLDLDFASGNTIPYILRGLLLIVIAMALFFLYKNSSLEQKLFIGLIYIVTAGVLVIPDVFLGGIRSATGRYFVPVNIASILVVAYFLVQNLTVTDRASRTWWTVLAALVVSGAIVSNINSLQAETWWNKNQSRIQPEFVHEINHDQTLLIVSGEHPTNLGDMLLLSFEIASDVHFRLYQDPDEIIFPEFYQNIYWFPSSYEEMQAISQKKGLQTTEVIQGILWHIDDKLGMSILTE